MDRLQGASSGWPARLPQAYGASLSESRGQTAPTLLEQTSASGHTGDVIVTANPCDRFEHGPLSVAKERTADEAARDLQGLDIGWRLLKGQAKRMQVTLSASASPHRSQADRGHCDDESLRCLRHRNPHQSQRSPVLPVEPGVVRPESGDQVIGDEAPVLQTALGRMHQHRLRIQAFAGAMLAEVPRR